jgi:histone deacetylase 11
MPQIVYSSKYNIGFYGLEKLHPFDSRKYGRAWKLLRDEFGAKLTQWHVKPKRQVSWQELLQVHSGEYLLKLKKSAYVARALELPPLAKLPGWLIDWQVLRPMRWATRGTIIAAEQALQHGLAINLSGGYHHASPGRGEGFSIYADVGVAVASLRKSSLIAEDARVLHIDTDAHQGNGVSRTFMDDSRAFLFDIFNHRIYPADPDARQRIDCAVPVDSSTTNSEYLGELKAWLPGFLDSISNQKVGIAFYNAGTDVFASDPLGQLNISEQTILQRDMFVVDQLRKRNIPTVMVLSGGYTKQSYRLVANSAIELLKAKSS